MESHEDIIQIKSEPMIYSTQQVSNDHGYRTHVWIKNTTQPQRKSDSKYIWSHQAIKCLIKIYGQQKSVFPSQTQNRKLFDRISIEMKKHGFSVSNVQCRNKWRGLMKRYNSPDKTKDSTKLCETQPFVYRKRMDRILKDDAILMSTVKIDSSLSNSSQHLSQENLVLNSNINETNVQQPKGIIQHNREQSLIDVEDKLLITIGDSETPQCSTPVTFLGANSFKSIEKNEFDVVRSNNIVQQDEELSTNRIRDIVSELVQGSSKIHLDAPCTGVSQFLKESPNVDSFDSINDPHLKHFEAFLAQNNSDLESSKRIEDEKRSEKLTLHRDFMSELSSKSGFNGLEIILRYMENSLHTNSLNEKFISEFNEFRVELMNYLKSIEEKQKLRHEEKISLRQNVYEVQKRMLKVQEERLELEKKRVLAIAENIIL